MSDIVPREFHFNEAILQKYLDQMKPQMPYVCSFETDKLEVWQVQEDIINWAFKFCNENYPKEESKIFETYCFPIGTTALDDNMRYKIYLLSRFRELPIRAKLSLNV